MKFDAICRLSWPVVLLGMLLWCPGMSAEDDRAKLPGNKNEMTGKTSSGEKALPENKKLFSSTGMELVRVPAGYWVSKHEVTQEQYLQVMKSNPSRWKEKNHPVENVDWKDAAKFCEQLTLLDISAGIISGKQHYSLPKEEQWAYYVGDAKLEDMVRRRWNGRVPLGTAAVGSRAPNKYGLYDVRGNVWEWCSDWWCSKQNEKVLRGGSWDLVSAEDLEVSYRPVSAAVARDGNIGFRVVLQEK